MQERHLRQVIVVARGAHPSMPTTGVWWLYWPEDDCGGLLQNANTTGRRSLEYNGEFIPPREAFIEEDSFCSE